MKPFEFHAELFDFRNAVLEALSDNGFAWLSDYGSIDLQHDVYGLEVTSIREEADAAAIEQLLRRMFPGWRYRRTFYEDRNLGELGWKVMISRDPEDFGDHWPRQVSLDVMPHSMSSSQASIRASYDIACDAYARKFIKELDHKPFDRELLKQFAAVVGAQRPVLDLGCGPGHTTAHLTSLGLLATGLDLSPKMIERASASFPQSRFAVGDFFALPYESSSIAGIVAFYCIVHLRPDQLIPAFAEMFRVLKGGGVLLLSFHVGSEVVHAENFLDTNAALDFTFFEPLQIEAALGTVGFDAIDVRIRTPYDTEYPSTRCYVFAQKAHSMA